MEGMRCYGRTKLQGEFAISAVAQNVEYVILRPTVVIDIQDLMKLRDWSKARKHLSVPATLIIYMSMMSPTPSCGLWSAA